jgi:L-ascorbate metabolism protein UlaG (beta-lactamase superfamily)
MKNILSLLSSFLFTVMFLSQAFAGCGLELVQRLAIPVNYALAGKNTVLIQRLGHSSFLITSPGGTTVLTDPFAPYLPDIPPDIATVSNLHHAHDNTQIIKGNPLQLLGVNSQGEWNKIDQKIKDVRIFNVYTLTGGGLGINSAFVFEVGDVCIAHLGNLGHRLNEEQLKAIGRVDVALISVDGSWTMRHEDVLGVIAQLRPRIVIPMQYDFRGMIENFISFVGDRYKIHKVENPTLEVSKGLLPASTEIVILGHRP